MLTSGPFDLRNIYFIDDDKYDVSRTIMRELAKQSRDRLEHDAADALAFVVKKKKRDDWVLVAEAKCIRETDKAILVRVPPARVLGKKGLTYIPTEVWIPKSQLHPTENEVAKLGDEGFLVIPEWIVKEKGL